MFANHEDYIKFLNYPKHYVDCSLKFKEMRFENNLKRDYPVAECDDIILYFNHYISFEEANSSWQRRKERIHWDNIFVMFYDEDPERIKRFCNLPYAKKVCFVPFHSDDDQVISVEYRIDEKLKEKPFWQIVNGMASGKWLYYNAFDLILEGIFTPVARFKS